MAFIFKYCWVLLLIVVVTGQESANGKPVEDQRSPDLPNNQQTPPPITVTHEETHVSSQIILIRPKNKTRIRTRRDEPATLLKQLDTKPDKLIEKSDVEIINGTNENGSVSERFGLFGPGGLFGGGGGSNTNSQSSSHSATFNLGPISAGFSTSHSSANSFGNGGYGGAGSNANSQANSATFNVNGVGTSFSSSNAAANAASNGIGGPGYGAGYGPGIDSPGVGGPGFGGPGYADPIGPYGGGGGSQSNSQSSASSGTIGGGPVVYPGEYGGGSSYSNSQSNAQSSSHNNGGFFPGPAGGGYRPYASHGRPYGNGYRERPYGKPDYGGGYGGGYGGQPGYGPGYASLGFRSGAENSSGESADGGKVVDEIVIKEVKPLKIVDEPEVGPVWSS